MCQQTGVWTWKIHAVKPLQEWTEAPVDVMAISLCCLVQFHLTEIRQGHLRTRQIPARPHVFACPSASHTHTLHHALLFSCTSILHVSASLSLQLVDDRRSVPANPGSGSGHIDNVQRAIARRCTLRSWSMWNAIAGPHQARQAGCVIWGPMPATPKIPQRGDATEL